MATKTVRVNLEIPEGISAQIRDAVQSRAEEAVVLALWESGEISTSRAAEELGLNYYDFLDLVSARGLPMLSGGEINTEAIEEAQRRLASDVMRQRGYGIANDVYEKALRAAGEWTGP